jgi:hypothetical protein
MYVIVTHTCSYVYICLFNRAMYICKHFLTYIHCPIHLHITKRQVLWVWPLGIRWLFLFWPEKILLSEQRMKKTQLRPCQKIVNKRKGPNATDTVFSSSVESSCRSKEEEKSRSCFVHTILWAAFQRFSSFFVVKKLRPILNFDPRGEAVPQGWIVSPRGEVVIPWGWDSQFAPSFF